MMLILLVDPLQHNCSVGGEKLILENGQVIWEVASSTVCNEEVAVTACEWL